jgi:hypothetical protein
VHDHAEVLGPHLRHDQGPLDPWQKVRPGRLTLDLDRISAVSRNCEEERPATASTLPGKCSGGGRCSRPCTGTRVFLLTGIPVRRGTTSSPPPHRVCETRACSISASTHSLAVRLRPFRSWIVGHYDVRYASLRFARGTWLCVNKMLCLANSVDQPGRSRDGRRR